MENTNNILVERKESIIYQLDKNNVGNGWIGGNAPAYFDDKGELLSEIGSDYNF